MKRGVPHVVLVVLLLMVFVTAAAVPVGVGQAQKSSSIRYVSAVNGIDSGNSCLNPGNPCKTIQYALDQAAVDDVLYVAAGTYQVSGGGTVAHITKAVHIKGGYSLDFTEFNPNVYLVTLDGGAAAPVVHVDNAGSAYLQHLIIQNGNGTDQCSNSTYDIGCGGGVLSRGSDLFIAQCTVRNNVAQDIGSARGGGIYAEASGHLVEIWESLIEDNTGSLAGTAPTEYSYGGGAYIDSGNIQIRDNEFRGNLGSTDYSGSGALNIIRANQALIEDNYIHDNDATSSNYYAASGGIHITISSLVVVENNRIEYNSCGAAGYGGGIYVNQSDATVSGNLIRYNDAGAMSGFGGGIAVLSEFPVLAANNMIYENQAMYGGGVWVGRSGAPASQAVLWNNTIAGHGSSGVYAEGYADLDMINNLISGNAVGIAEDGGGNVLITADHNLLWNTSDPLVGTNAIIAEPMFWGDHLLMRSSPAVDSGLAIAQLIDDMYGNPRPLGTGYDLGAVEMSFLYLPLISK